MYIHKVTILLRYLSRYPSSRLFKKFINLSKIPSCHNFKRYPQLCHFVQCLPQVILLRVVLISNRDFTSQT